MGGWLVAQCDVVKKSFGNTYFGLDACMANLMLPGMYDSYHHITVAGRTAEPGDLARSNVVGTLCENNDWFAKDRMLPKDCDVGDIGYSNNSEFTNLMDEREQCYRASAQQPRKKHKLTPDEFLFQKSGFEK